MSPAFDFQLLRVRCEITRLKNPAIR